MTVHDIESPATVFAAPFAFRDIGDGCVVTNPAGQFAFLALEELAAFVEGRLDEHSDAYARLDGRNFIRKSLDTEDLANRIAKRRAYLRQGPWQHDLLVTLRHPGTRALAAGYDRGHDATDADMSAGTAEHCVDLALLSTAPAVTLVFRGGEPLLSFDVMRHAVEYANDRNDAIRKDLGISLVSDLSAMDDEKLDWLVRNKVHVVAAVDGPAPVHDQLHSLGSRSAYAETARWIGRLREAGLEHVDATFALTRHALGHADEIIDSYRELGIRSMMVELIPPELASGHGAPREEALGLYLELVDRMLAGAKQGQELAERLASVLLSRILQQHDPNYLGLRSPAGGGTGGLVYGHDGTVYPSEHGRRAHLDGDDLFVLGDVEHSGYDGILRHETVSAMLVASMLEANPGCALCAYQPYCGVLPDENHRLQGSLHGRVRDSYRARILVNIQDHLFRLIRDADPAVMAVLKRWSAPDEHRHFVV